MPTAERSREDRELRELLHRRLRIISSLGLCMSTCLLISFIMISGRYFAPLHSGIALCLTLPTYILYTNKKLSLVSLRRIELFIFVISYAAMTALCMQRLKFVAHVPAVPTGLAAVLQKDILFYMFPDGSYYTRFSANVFANQIIIMWGVLAVGYGVLIPSTWRRCAIFMAATVLGALQCSSYVLYCFRGMRTYAAWTLFYTVFTVSGFAAIGLYGSHKINALRRAVLTAREVGQYTLKQLLGKGGMGEVYLAHHRMLRRPCAVKLIRSEQAGDAASLMRFEREVQAMAKLTHPNTVEIYDYGRTEEGVFYYAMEYLPGLSAEALVRQHGAIPPGRAIHFLRQVCGALAEAHAAGLIHRDIKPANLLICERGGVYDVVKLLDFGLVQQLGGLVLTAAAGPEEKTAGAPIERETGRVDLKLTQAGHILGTPAYMSPEQARNGSVEARSDVYSVGAVGYYLLSGQPPFMKASVAKMMKAHESERPTPLMERVEEMDGELSAVIMKCLEKEAEDRYQSVKELETALGRCESAEQWNGEKAQKWWEQVKPDLAPEAGESAAGLASRGSLIATLDATRREDLDATEDTPSSAPSEHTDR